MQIVRETSGYQTLYRLTDEEVDHTLGRAVISENDGEVRFHTLYVEPKYRGMGYGKALMKAVLSHAKEKPVTLCTGWGNVSFFKKYDFEITETTDSLVFMKRKSLDF